MNCKNCGAELCENAVFCGNCGMKTEPEVQPAVEEPVSAAEEKNEAPENPVFTQEINNNCQESGSYQPPVFVPEANDPNAQVPMERPNTVLWIILSAAQTFLCCGITGIIGLIFSILGHVAADKGDFADAASKVRVAKILFWVGFVIGLLSLIALIFIALVFGIGLFAAVGEEFFYYY